MCAHVHACHNTCVEVSGQFARVDSLFLPCVGHRLDSSIRFDGRHLYLLSHLASSMVFVCGGRFKSRFILLQMDVQLNEKTVLSLTIYFYLLCKLVGSRFMNLFLGLYSVSLAHVSDFMLVKFCLVTIVLVLFYYVNCL